jgi:hypothetical protein
MTVAGVATMRATRLVAPGRFEVETAPIPVPGPREVLIRLEGSGVCASNLEVWEGRPWFTYPLEPGAPGHEGWGTVEAVGPGVEHLHDGDRVTFLSGRAFAELDVADAASVVKLPSELADRPFPGEPLGCAINIFHRSRIAPGATVAIVGIGFLGAILTRLMAAAGARVLAITRRDYALHVARGMGAHETIPMDDHHGVIDRVRELTELRRSVTIAAALTIPILVLDMFPMWIPPLGHWLHGLAPMETFYYLFFVLATAVQFGPGLRFYEKGWPSLVRGAPDMNSLVMIGTSAAYGYSVVATFLPWLLPAGVGVSRSGRLRSATRLRGPRTRGNPGAVPLCGGCPRGGYRAGREGGLPRPE